MALHLHAQIRQRRSCIGADEDDLLRRVIRHSKQPAATLSECQQQQHRRAEECPRPHVAGRRAGGPLRVLWRKPWPFGKIKLDDI